MKFFIVLMLLFSSLVMASETMTVYKNKSCGCCTKWVQHLRNNGFKVKVKEVPVDNLEMIKNKYNVPKEKRSCHTAVLGKHVFEGHVPASSIKKFLKSKSLSIGLTVPDMPMGSPGMEYGNHKDHFIVYKFDKKGNTTSFEKF